MTKISAIIKKNFKLILRSKVSALIILLGPILVMLIIGLAFNEDTGQRINVGYFTHEKSELTESFISKIATGPYNIQEFESIETCKEAIGAGKIHICIGFPKDFRIENNKVNRIDFLVDNSKVNFFRTVLDSIENDFNEKALELTSGMTQELLSKLNQTSEEISNKSELISILKQENSEIAVKLSDTQKAIQKMDLDFDVDDLDLDDLQSFGRDIDKLKDIAEDAIDETEDLVDDIEDFIDDQNLTSSAENDLEDILNKTQESINTIKDDLNDTSGASSSRFSSLVGNLEDNLNELDKSLNVASSSKQSSLKNIETLKAKTQSSLAKIDEVETTFQAIVQNINQTEVTNLQSIVKPIEKNILPVIAEESQLNFYFPYLVILIIMFIGILLSSTLVSMEKSSTAYFRNFVTPTNDSTFLISKYLTTMLFILIQIIFVLLIFALYFGKDVLTNIQTTIIILLLSASIFTLIGMLIGNIFNSNETNMLASITVSSIMLFISDLIFPLERMPQYMADIAMIYNPFYVCSDLLRKSMVHKLGLIDMPYELIVLALTAGLLMMAVWLSHKFIKKHFLMRFAGYMARRDVKRNLAREDYMKIYTRMNAIPHHSYFKPDEKTEIKDLKDMISYLTKLDKKAFQKYVNSKHNLVADWVSNSLMHESLANMLYKTKSKNKTISLLKKAQKQFEKFHKEMSNKKE